MIRIKQTVDNIIYSYKPNEFMPIWSDGELLNKRDFVIYKLHALFVKRSLI